MTTGSSTHQPPFGDESFEARERRVVLRTLRDHALDPARLELQCVNAGDLIAQAMDLLRGRERTDKRIAFIGGTTSGSLSVRASYSWLWCAVEHLIRSAMRAARAPGRVEIMAQPFRFNRDEILFSVRNDGAAVPPDTITRMLAQTCETYRESEDQEDPRGFCFALVVAGAVVRAHGGRVWVESEEDEGTTVYFTLPRA